MSSTFASLPAVPQTLCPDPSKHVNFTIGMLLGVADFQQEFAYHTGHLQSLARDALGYGTLNGLALALSSDARGIRVQVTAGSALLPNGKQVCVRPAQCAYINEWLIANQGTALSAVLSPPSVLPLYLVLCCRECPVDLVPIPGEPCRTEDELFAPSRLVDDFVLDFRTAPPRQTEEDGIREFGEWLETVLVVQNGAAAVDLDELAASIIASLPTADAVAATGLQLSTASPMAPVAVDPGQWNLVVRLLLRLWVTNIRPLVHPPCAGTSSCCGGSSDVPRWDDCLLLGRFDVPIINIGPGVNLRVDDTIPVQIDQSQRPILPSLRLLAQLQLQLGGS